MTLCERFPALTPFEIREKSVYEVFLLINRLNAYGKRQKKGSKGSKGVSETRNKQGETVIRRPASDDWY